LRVAGLVTSPINAEFEALFEVGVDEMRWDDLHDGKQHVWPTLSAVRDYRQQAYNVICNLIKTAPQLGEQIISQASPFWALFMGFEHERIHLETSSVLIRELPIELVKKPDSWPEYFSSSSLASAHNELISVPECEVSIGKPQDFPTYGWDNEYGFDSRKVRKFSASKFLITNAEFLEFVKDGGYAAEQFWSQDGWKWKSFRNIKWPSFWVQNGPAGSHLFKLRTIFEVVDMEANLPVCVNFHEAKAYCNWLTKKQDSAMPYRLLTEAEHNAIRDEKPQLYNSQLASGGESPVNFLAANDKGFHDVFGNVWNWCEDNFHPLTGAKPHPYYDDFSVPCYDGQHQIILGGSFISSGDAASEFARFHFRPHFFQHAGFRIARNEDGNPDCDEVILNNTNSEYETKAMLSKYLLMHYAQENELWHSDFTPPNVVHLPLKCAELVAKYTTNFDSVLDLGCAVGRSSFELARSFKNVLGVEYSHEFVNTANILKHSGEVKYFRKDSGTNGVALTAKIAAEIDRSRVNFEHGDACNLSAEIGSFDAVLLANVLCRLPEPIACLQRFQGKNTLLKSGGVLVMTTPFSWLEEYTSKENWLNNGIADVQKILTEFELIHQEELPFMIREHQRKFEYIITQASVWRKK